MENFKYSVLMSVYYKENPEWLKQSIESILNQTVKTDDFVIIKDGKLTNDLDKVIEEYEKTYSSIRVIELEKNVGLGPALAVGVNECKNEWIARMDSDDVSVPERIEKQMKIVKDKNVDMVGSNIAEFTDNIGNVQSYRDLPETDEQIKVFARRRNPFGHPSMLLRKEKILEAGNFREYYLCEDYDMWNRMIEKNAIGYNIQEYLVFMRISKDFYKRRGGIKYLKAILKFKKEQYNKGFYSLNDYIITALASIFTCLSPNGIREYIYKKLLRKRK